MCGENGIGGWVLWETQGSPPHVRGKRVIQDILDEGLRITPACAGKTLKNPYPINVCQSLRFLFL